MLHLLLSLNVLAVDDDSLRQLLESRYPALEITAVEPAPVAGWRQFVTTAGQVFYVDADAEHLFTGEVISLADGENRTALRRDQARRELLAGFDPTFRFPAGDERAAVTVVTDIDCPYCRRLHQQMADYNALGISVNYLLLPRSGPNTPSWTKAVAAACDRESPAAAITRAMNGEELPLGDCANNIEAELQLARLLNVTGTPSIVLDSGRLLDGYLPPERLAMELGIPADPGKD